MKIENRAFTLDELEIISAANAEIRELQRIINRLQEGLAAIETRWRAASQDSCFRKHYRETMELCADELRDLLTGFDDGEIQDEISKAFAAGEA